MIGPRNTIRSSKVEESVAKGDRIIESRLAANPDGFLIVLCWYLTVCIILMVEMASLYVENGGWISVF